MRFVISGLRIAVLDPGKRLNINSVLLQAVDEGFEKEFFVHMQARRLRRSDAHRQSKFFCIHRAVHRLCTSYAT